MTRKKRALKRKIKNIILSLLILFFLGIASFCGYKIWNVFHIQSTAEKEVENINLLVQNSLGDASLNTRFSKSAYKVLKQENEDFLAYLSFDSGLISLPVVQSYDNDFYLRKSFYKEYADLGTPFFHYESKLDSQNLMIYGHNSSTSTTVMFSPLRTLLDQNVFEKNNVFNLYFENEVRNYEIIAMYWYDITTDGEYNFQVTDWYDSDNFNNYFSFVNSRNLITPRTTYDFTDNFVTLQTCKSNEPNYRLVVVAVETSRGDY